MDAATGRTVTSSAAKAKGSQFEREVVAVLRANGHPTAERAMHFPDRGDVDGLPRFVIEVKCHKTMDLAGWMDEAIEEARTRTCAMSDCHERTHGRIPVVVAKRRGKPAERAYVVMELADFARMVADG